MRDLAFISRVGPMTGVGLSPTGPTTTIPFRIEVETADGPAVLSLSPNAAAELGPVLS